MIQEYLFTGKNVRDKIANYVPENITSRITDIDGTDCWIVSYYVDGKSEDAARQLSVVNRYICDNYEPIILSNESAAFYNQKLFPLINEFERKLRKLLYLKSALAKGTKASENISQLEEKALGEVFDLLFTDERFITDAKARINQKTWKYSKAEIIDTLNAIQENTNWDSLLGEKAVPTLRNGFIKVRKYRNDVMHAHNIDYDTYREAKKTFAQINEQFDDEISLIVSDPTNSETVGSEFNDSLNKAIQSLSLADALSEYYKNVQDYAGFETGIKQLSQSLAEVMEATPSFIAMQESLRSLAEAISFPAEQISQLNQTAQEWKHFYESMCLPEKEKEDGGKEYHGEDEKNKTEKGRE